MMGGQKGEKMQARSTQIGGDHYASKAVQPSSFMQRMSGLV